MENVRAGGRPGPDAAETEKFWTRIREIDGEDARQPNPVAEAKPDSPRGQGALTQFKRDRLLIELLFAARSVAHHALQRMEAPDPSGAHAFVVMFRCRECRHALIGGRDLVHESTCRVGRVLAAIAALGGGADADAGSGGGQ